MSLPIWAAGIHHLNEFVLPRFINRLQPCQLCQQPLRFCFEALLARNGRLEIKRQAGGITTTYSPAIAGATDRSRLGRSTRKRRTPKERSLYWVSSRGRVLPPYLTQYPAGICESK